MATIITVISAKAHYNTSGGDSNYIILRDALSNAAMLNIKIQISLNPNIDIQQKLHEQIEHIVDLVNERQIDVMEISAVLDKLAPLTQQIISQELHGIKQIM